MRRDEWLVLGFLVGYAAVLMLEPWMEPGPEPDPDDPVGEHPDDVWFEPEPGASHGLPPMRIPQASSKPIRALAQCPCGRNHAHWIRRSDLARYCDYEGKIYWRVTLDELLEMVARAT